jgi:hypothetical protein
MGEKKEGNFKPYIKLDQLVIRLLAEAMANQIYSMQVLLS